MSPDAMTATADALVSLREALVATRLELETVGAGDARYVRRELVEQIDDYLMPRLRQLDAPLLVVIAGSTGAGKSTIFNSLLGAEISPAGVLRPTTRAPVLGCNPDDERWFTGDRVLPGLARATGVSGVEDGATLHLVAHGGVPAGLSLLDAPDIDSVVSSNRDLAAELLGAADLWLWVTTAARYADAVPWEFLRKARARSTALALVLNRVPAEAMVEVPRHLEAMLGDEGLGGARIFVFPEQSLEDGLLDEGVLKPLSAWIDDLAADAEARAAVVRQTLEGALRSLDDRVATVISGVRAQIDASRELQSALRASYAEARLEIDTALSGGALLRGEVLARWHELVGTGDFMRSLETRIGRLRDRLQELFLGVPSSATEVRATLGGSVEEVVAAAADKAAERTAARWKAAPAGGVLLSGGRSLERASPDLRGGVASEVRAWQGTVLELVRAEGADKRATGRALSLGVNAVGAALMVSVFAHTGGLTGAEVVIAGGTATVSQRLLEALFGDQAVRSLTARARADLLARIDRLLGLEAGRFEALLTSLTPDPESPNRLQSAARAVGASLP